MLRRRKAHSAPGEDFVLPDVDRERIRGLFPIELGEYLDAGIPDPEHRIASIAFIKFSGTDALLAGPGPDVLAEALHRTVSLVEEALAPESISLLATDLDSDGGKFFLGSGIPTSFEDNEGRMLRALRRIADSDSPLPLQLGVNRGHVFAAEVGIPERGAYTGMGDTTNTAARIMSKATAGKLYAHPAVLEHSRTRFAVTPAGPFAMKGKAVPLLVYEVGEELGTAEETTAESRLPFLGRDEELATVRAALDEALAGAGGVITISGANGMGKSRLAFEALEGTQPRRSSSSGPSRTALPAPTASSATRCAACSDSNGTPPRQWDRPCSRPWRQVAPDLLPMAPLLADVVQVDVPSTPEVDQLDPQYRPDRLADAVVRLVDAMMPGPLALVAEEAHWADGASARLLDRIAAASSGRPWAVIAVRRGEEGGFAPAAGTQVTLEPLPAGGHGAPGHRRDRGHAAAPARDRRGGRPRPGQPAVRRGGHAGRPEHGLAGHASRVGPGRHERPDRPAAPGCPAGPALLRGPGAQLPRRGAAPDPGHGRAGGRRLDPEQPAARSCSRTARTGGSSATAWSATPPTRDSPTRSAAACTAPPARPWRR